MADVVKETEKKKGKKERRFVRKESRLKEDREAEEIIERCQNLDASEVSKFIDFPLSSRTLRGLQQAGFGTPTEIQKEGISLALRGYDVLGAAKTGSGKTLAFLIPVLELLWKNKWSQADGLGALIISPTRELAYQTFEVLRKVGCHHDFSAGLIIGGKDLKNEQERICRTSIIICTPGRLLQHMDETPNFDCSQLQILVLDEADRILDLGFAKAMNGILENLPEERQTLLYSATQTKSVKDLARLSLSDPEYISVHENSKSSTPQSLKQSYVVCELQEKIDFLYSFIKNHLKSKILVFVSSCKQVKFIYEVFRRLRPGVPLMALYGKQKQMKRVAIYENFCKSTSAVLLATDIAARGLDFPAVHWVVQLDCPEDTNTYIHRAGRTARFHKDGQALLILLPSEEAEMVKELEAKKIPISKIRVNPKKLSSLQKKLQALCAQDQEIKLWAQKSIVTYARSVFLQSNKKIFDVHKLPLETYALSLGLPCPPRIRFLKKLEKKFGPQNSKEDAAVPESVAISNSDSEDDSIGHESESEETEKLPSSLQFGGADGESDDEGDLLVLKKKDAHRQIPEKTEALPNDEDTKEGTSFKQKSRVALAKKILNKKIKVNTKIIFDDEGEPIGDDVTMKEDANKNDLTPVPLGSKKAKEVGGINVDDVARSLKQQDVLDRQKERQRVRAMHKEKRVKMRQKRKEAQGEDVSLEPFRNDEDELVNQLDDNASSADESEPKFKKSKHTEADSDEESTTDFPDGLADDEALAMHLLKNS